MNRFDRDFALVSVPKGRVICESHSRSRLEEMQHELAVEGLECVIIKSDVPRDIEARRQAAC